MTLDRRLNAFRPDLAEVSLKGKVEAERFVEGIRIEAATMTARLPSLGDDCIKPRAFDRACFDEVRRRRDQNDPSLLKRVDGLVVR